MATLTLKEQEAIIKSVLEALSINQPKEVKTKVGSFAIVPIFEKVITKEEAEKLLMKDLTESDKELKEGKYITAEELRARYGL